jgi:hypothetical protein
MSEDRIEAAIKSWAAEKLGVREDRVKSVDFGVIHGGFCETCEYTTFGATVYLTGGARREIEEYGATDVIREIAGRLT